MCEFSINDKRAVNVVTGEIKTLDEIMDAGIKKYVAHQEEVKKEARQLIDERNKLKQEVIGEISSRSTPIYVIFILCIIIAILGTLTVVHNTTSTTSTKKTELLTY